MRINGIHISEYGATLLDRNISSNRVSYNARWDYLMDRPAFYGNALEFKDVLLYLKVVAKTEEEFLKSMGRICEELRKGAVVRFDDIELDYTMYMKQKPEYTKLNATTYRLDFVLDGDYGLGILEHLTGTKSVTVNNEGIYPTPARLEINTTTQIPRVVISGFERALELVNLPANATVVVDGMKGTITVNGTSGIAHMQSFHFPKLPVGRSTIMASVSCKINLEYYERY